jgi:hypothetical protein
MAKCTNDPANDPNPSIDEGLAKATSTPDLSDIKGANSTQVRP